MNAEHWMARALALADRGAGRTAPNPMVGAVIVRPGPGGQDELLAEGWHRAAGESHAEVDALGHLGGRAPGATMYVNLEPCCHYGRTPPCTDALLNSGIARVVVGMVDPDPRMRGRGLSILRDAGVDVQVGVLHERAVDLNAPYLVARRLHRPLISLKAAVTLDGRISSADGESQWITGEEARADGHRLRDRHDAILVGSGTLLADDPSLTTRIEGGRDALPVVLDTDLRCPEGARVLHAGRRPLIFCADDAGERSLPADIVRVPRDGAGLAWAPILARLVDRDVHSVLVEGGGRVHRTLLDAGLVDRLALYLAPRVLAGGPGWVGGEPYSLDQAPRFQRVGVCALGQDLRLDLVRAQPDPET